MKNVNDIGLFDDHFLLETLSKLGDPLQKLNEYIDFYGYKNHIKADTKTKLIEEYIVTDASVHDSQAIEQLLTTKDEGQPLYADSAYTGEDQETVYKKRKVINKVIEKGHRNKPLTEEQKSNNKEKSRTRARVVRQLADGFVENSMHDSIISTIGIARAKAKIGMMNLKVMQRHFLAALAISASTLAQTQAANPGTEPGNDIVSNHIQLMQLPLGSITAQGWLKAQFERSKAGMGGHLDELEPEMIAKPYVTRDFHSKVSPGWSEEISGTYWTGLVQLAFTLNNAELKAKAEKWVHATLAFQEDDGYLGSYRKTENRLDDFCPWSTNWCYRTLLSWYDATGDQKVLNAVHRGLLWFVEHWAGDQKTDYAGPTLTESRITVYLKTGDERLYQWCISYLAWLDKNDKFKHGMASLQRAGLE